MKLALKYKIGKKGIKLVLKKVKSSFRKKGIKLVAHAGNVLANVHSLSLPGRKFNRGCTFLAQNSICDRFTKFLAILFFLFTFYIIQKCASVCLNYFFYIAYFFLLFHLFCSISLIYSMFFFLHAVWDKYCQEDSLCTKCAI